MIYVDILNFREEMSRYIKYAIEFGESVKLNTGNGNAVLISEETYNQIVQAMDDAEHVKKGMTLDDIFSYDESDSFPQEHITTWDDIIAFYTRLPYKIDMVTNPDGSVTAIHPELQGCVVCGSDKAEAKLFLYSARRGWITKALRDGTGVPLPKYKNGLNMGKIKRAGKIVSSEEALVDVEPIDWAPEVLSGRKKARAVADIDALVEHYMSLNYRIEIVKDEAEGGYAAQYPELKGCITCAKNIQAVIANLEDAKREWFNVALEDYYPIPKPDSNEFHISYRGYTGTVEFSEEDQIFHGRLIDANDTVLYDGNSVASLAEDFINTVEEYVEFCDLKWTKPDNKGYQQSSEINGLSADKIEELFRESVEEAIKERQQSGLPVVLDDNENKRAYLEYPDGRREYIDGQGDSDE